MIIILVIISSVLLKRGTNIAISLAHDVSMYCKDKTSPVFLCGLDAEGAFDGIPHPVLFNKCRHVVPDFCWKLLYNWYSDISVRIKWYTLGKDIQICKGMRQGVLTSPFLFIVFYKDLVDILASHEGGITIDGVRFNVFVYADDILLASTTASGLQNLIDSAVSYVLQHGLHLIQVKHIVQLLVKTLF